MDTHERLVRMDEQLQAHIDREEQVEKRWFCLLEKQSRQIDTLHTKLDTIIEARASLNGALRALLWVGGLVGGAIAIAASWFRH